MEPEEEPDDTGRVERSRIPLSSPLWDLPVRKSRHEKIGNMTLGLEPPCLGWLLVGGCIW